VSAESETSRARAPAGRSGGGAWPGRPARPPPVSPSLRSRGAGSSEPDGAPGPRATRRVARSRCGESDSAADSESLTGRLPVSKLALSSFDSESTSDPERGQQQSVDCPLCVTLCQCMETVDC
jgi:hypothetical protein